MRATLGSRQSRGFKAVAWLLTFLMLTGPATSGAWATRAPVVVAPHRVDTSVGKRVARGDTMSSRPAIVPRRVRPQALELLAAVPSEPSGDPWSWFDGSSAPGVGRGPGHIVVRATLPEPTKLVRLGTWGGSRGRLSVAVERDGRRVPIAGLVGLDLGGLPDGWHSFAASEPTWVRTLILEWESHGDGLRELELWGLGEPPSDAREAEPADELYGTLPPGALQLAATPAEARVASSAPAGASFAFSVASDPRAFERAFLVYELENIAHWTSVPRQVNGHLGPILQASGPTSPGRGGLQVEEIVAAWLQVGANQLRFLPVPGSPYVIRHPRLVVVGAQDIHTERVEPIAQVVDLAFREAVKPQQVAFQLLAPSQGRLTIRTGDGAGSAASVDLDGLAVGWHWAPVDQLPVTDRIHVSFADSIRAGAVADVSISASPIPVEGAATDRLLVSHPLHGECVGAGAYLRGLVGPGLTSLVVGGQVVATYPEDGSFSSLVPRADRTVEIEARYADGQRLHRSIAIGPCIDGPREVSDVTAEGGKRRLDEDAGAPFGAVVTPDTERTLSFAGATLEIPRGAVERGVRITIRPLTEGQVQPMDGSMENVVTGGGGFRFGPRGMVFRKPIRITLPVDPSRLPAQTTEQDVYSFYFDEPAQRWRRVGRVGAIRPGTMTSLTDHFTDFVNATRPVPDHPSEQQFNPHSITDLKLGDPAAGIDLIQAPGADTSGTARITQPIELPPARHVHLPGLQFAYSSDQPNSWMGVGWDLHTPSIEIDTRFGVPRYDGHERYLFDGDMLAGPDPVSGEFRRRVEGRFDRIQRFGADPTSYSWLVTDKDGTRYTFGASAAARLSDPAPDRPPVIFRWYLERIEDVFGNRIDLSYTRDAGNNGEPWVQIYPARIDYTSHPSGLSAEYRVVFALEPDDRPDVIITARPGFQVLTRKRLDFVDVQLAGEVIRRYDVTYQTGDFDKSLVASIAQLGVGARAQLYAHSFTYFTAPTQDGLPDVFAPFQPWGQVQRPGGVPRPEDGLSRADESLSGGSGSLGIGIGPVSLTVGAGAFSGNDRTSLTTFDRHGDGLPDFLDGGGGGSRNVLQSTLPTSGSFLAEPVSGLGPDSLGRTDRSGWTVNGGLNVGGLAGAAASYSRTTAEDTRIITDVDGDGFPDLLSADNGQVSVRLGDGRNHFGTPQTFGQLALDDIVFGNQQRHDAADRSLHRIDPIVRWTAPFDGMILLTGAIQRLSNGGDGSTARILHNGALIWQRTITDTQPCEPVLGNGCGGGILVPVAAGDRIFTQLEAVGAPVTEDIAWDPVIAYQVDAGLAGLREPNGPFIYRFSQRDDHRLVGRPAMPWAASASGSVAVRGTVHKLATSDDVTIQIVKHDKDHLNPTVLFSQALAAAQDAELPIAFDTSIVGQETLTFQVVSDTVVDPARVAWRPNVTYTNYCRTDPRNQNAVCGAVTCSVDADGRPVACQIAGDPFPQLPIPGAVISQDAQVYTPSFQTLPATPTATVVRSGPVSIEGEIQKGVTAAPVEVLVQGVNKLYFKRSFAPGDTGTFPASVIANLGASEQLFFTVTSTLDPGGAVAWSPTVGGVPAAVNVRFRDPSFADPVTDEPRDPMSGGYHRWFFGDWDGESPFSEAGIVFPNPDTTNAFMFVTPQRQGIAALPVPLWVGRGDGEYIADGQQRPSRLASSTTLVGSGSGGLDDLRIAETWNFNLGASVIGLGLDGSTGDTTSVVDLLDINGDHFPDSVFADGVRFNDGRGLGPKTPIDLGLGQLRFVEHRGLRAHAGAQGSLINVTTTAGDTKAVVSTGFNVGTDYSMSATQVDFVDMNGDGLLDHIEHRPGDGAIIVRLNLGFKFGAPIAWPTPAWSAHSFGTRADILRGVFGDAIGSDVVKLDDTGTNSLGVSGDVGVVGGGGGLAFTAGRNLVQFLDINGDGLPDQVMKLPDEHNVLRVKLNLGDRFGPEQHWPIPGWDGLDVDPPDFQFLPGGDALGFRRGQQFNFSFSAKVCFLVCIGGSAFHSQGPNWAQLAFEDIDGDGRLDHVLKLDGNANVYAKLNQIGKSNLLKTVTRPLGGTIELDYRREGNRTAPDESPRVDMPVNQWVLASTMTSDGRGNRYQETYDYQGSGFYDRVERESFGFGHIITTRVDDGSQVEEFIHNQDYYRKGLVFRTLEKDAAGNLFMVHDTVFQAPPATLPPLTGTLFPAEASRTTRFYEGTTADITNPGKTTSEERAFDDTGNLTLLVDRGEPGPEDDLISTVTWRRDAATHIMRPEIVQSVDSAGALLRSRRAAYREDGTLDTLTNVVVGGKNSAGVPYTGTVNLTSHFAYDDVGNLVSLVEPTGFTQTYAYDARMRLYGAGVTDSFGYHSAAVPNYRFATTAESTDLNGQKQQSVYDDFGRLVQVFGPNDIGADEPTITVEYGLQPGAAPQPAWVATRHKDDTRPGDPLTTVSFVDGLARVLEVKKDAEVDTGSATTVGMSVTGRVEFDARGRLAAQGQAVFDAGPATAFVDVPLKNPTRFEYDILSRRVAITMPDSARSRTDYGFGVLDGATYFQQTVTDPLGEIEATLRTARQEVRGEVQRNTIRGRLTTLTTRYQYNPLSERTHVIDASGNVTTAELDTAGRTVALTSPDGGRTEWRYDANGNLGAKQTANLRAQDQLISYVYTFNRLNLVIYPDHPAVSYVYGAPDAAGDAAGNRANRIAFEDSEAGRKELRYDRLGNVIDETTTLVNPKKSDEPFVHRMTYRYDTLGRVLEVDFPGLGREVVRYGYDAGGFVTSARGTYTEPDDLPPHVAVDTQYLQHIGYDEFGQKVRMVQGNGIETRYSYDPLTRRLAAVDADNQDAFMRQHGQPPRPFERLRYRHDLAGNVLELQNAVPVPDQVSDNSMQIGPVDQTYQYDNLHQLTTTAGLYQLEAKRQFRSSLALSYDEIGNIINKDQRNQREELVGQGVQIHVVPDTTYARNYVYGGPRPHAPTEVVEPGATPPKDADIFFGYDLDGNQVTRTQSDSPHPDVEQQWDAENRLKVASVPSAEQDMLYDCEGRRTHSQTRSKLTLYVNQYLTVSDDRVNSKHIYAGDQRIATKVEPQVGSRPAVFFYHTDHLQSTHAVSDEDQFLTEHDEYFATGEVWVDEGRVSETLNPRYLFNGKELDAATGYYYYGDRYYDARLSQWIAPDPALGDYMRGGGPLGGVEAPGHLALYTYTLNNPVILRDPTGRSVDEPGFWEGAIPIWGSGRSAVHHFQEGNWGRGTLHAALAVSDVFLVKALVVAAGKIVIKGGAKVVAEEVVSSGEKAAVNATETVASRKAAATGSEAGASVAQARSAELQEARRAWEAKNGTTAVIRGQHRTTGEIRDFIATEAPTQPRQFGALRTNEEFVEGAGHAEETIVKQRGAEWRFFEGGSSRNVCQGTCKPLLEGEGFKIGGPTFPGRADKTPFRMFWRE
jgi:RHS repeat-associated protein